MVSGFIASVQGHILVGHIIIDPLVARWIKWSLMINRLREIIAKETPVGVIGLMNSGKSKYFRSIFGIKVIVCYSVHLKVYYITNNWVFCGRKLVVTPTIYKTKFKPSLK